MPGENIAIVRRSVDAFGRGDWESALSEYHPDVRWEEMPSLGPDAATYTGRDALRGAAEKWIAMWDSYEVDVARYEEAGDQVVVLARERGSGGSSGAPVERELGEVFTLDAGQVTHVRLYGSWAEALKAIQRPTRASEMGSANVDLVRSICADWERGDWSSVGWIHRDFELLLDDGISERSYRGPAAASEGWGEFLGSWEDFRVSVEEYIELDHERVLTLIHNTGRGRRSGVAIASAGGEGISNASANLFEIRDGKVVRLTAYWSRGRALRELGLGGR